MARPKSKGPQSLASRIDAPSIAIWGILLVLVTARIESYRDRGAFERRQSEKVAELELQAERRSGRIALLEAEVRRLKEKGCAGE